MLFRLMVAAFWIISIIALIWILSKPRLRKRYSILSIAFAAFGLGILAAIILLIAYLAIIVFIIIVALFFLAFVISIIFGRKKRK